MLNCSICRILMPVLFFNLHLYSDSDFWFCLMFSLYIYLIKHLIQSNYLRKLECKYKSHTHKNDKYIMLKCPQWTLKHKINRRCDFTDSSYLTVTVYLQTHASIKHHISPICISVIFLYPETILVNFILTETLKIGFSLHVQEYACDSKRVRPLITRIVCTPTVYHDNGIFVIIHFEYIIFHLHNTLCYWNCSSGFTYINYSLTILSKNLPVLHKYCSKTPLQPCSGFNDKQ